MDDSCFEVGDLVTIRSWDDMLEEYGANTLSNVIQCQCGFTTKMRPFCGKQFVISAKHPDPMHPGRCYYKLTGGGMFAFSTDMFEPPEEFTPVSADSLTNILYAQ